MKFIVNLVCGYLMLSLYSVCQLHDDQYQVIVNLRQRKTECRRKSKVIKNSIPLLLHEKDSCELVFASYDLFIHGYLHSWFKSLISKFIYPLQPILSNNMYSKTFFLQNILSYFDPQSHQHINRIVSLVAAQKSKKKPS